jgi:4-carboxymuconolactone decarboxylase
MESETFRKGTELRAALLGSSLSSMDETARSGVGMKRFSDYTRSVIFGNLWLREGIDLRLRTLICVVTDVAMGVEDELAIHIEMALRQGWTETELVETILHAGSYVGIPRARQAILTADKTFARFREKEGGEASPER